jgi:hypothetical protein
MPLPSSTSCNLRVTGRGGRECTADGGDGAGARVRVRCHIDDDELQLAGGKKGERPVHFYIFHVVLNIFEVV